MDGQNYLVIGKISGVFGVKGWVKVFSYTEPRDNILNYKIWRLHKDSESRSCELQAGQAHSKGVVAKIVGVDDRDQAALMIGWDILIARTQLPPAEADEYYWADLEGLTVETTQGVILGVVDYLLETGANDVLVVRGERERLIPFLRQQTIITVDLDHGKIIVDWDPEF